MSDSSGVHGSEQRDLATELTADAVNMGIRTFRGFVKQVAEKLGAIETANLLPLLAVVWNSARETHPDLDEAPADLVAEETTSFVRIKTGIFGAGGYKVEFVCKRCSTPLEAPLDEVGKRISCPVCQGTLTIPGVKERDILRKDEAAIADTKCAAKEAQLAATKAKPSPKSARRTAKDAKQNEKDERARRDQLLSTAHFFVDTAGAQPTQDVQPVVNTGMRFIRAKSLVKRVFTKLRKPAIVALAAAAGGLAIWAAVWLLSPNRYTIINAGDGVIYKVDRRTGKMWRIDGNRSYATPVRER